MANTFHVFLSGIIIFFMFGYCCTEGTDDDQTFRCHVCSYTVHDQSNGYECLNNTDAMPEFQYSIKCGNYCVIQEQWDKSKREINSVFRSCSTNWGNSCYEDNTYITCRGSCKGEYCNNSTVTEKNRFEELCRELSCDATGSQSMPVTSYTSIITWIFLWMIVLYVS